MPFGFGKGGGRGRRGGNNVGHHRRRHRFVDSRSENCICPSCGMVALHQPGVPCFQTICPTCGATMTRQFATPFITTGQRKMPTDRRIPFIQFDLCTGCGQCVNVCPVNAISIIDKKAHIDEARCNGCKACISVCPKSAIL